jgi:hypothetical protein
VGDQAGDRGAAGVIGAEDLSRGAGATFVPGPLRKDVPEDVQLHALAATFFALLLAIYLFLVFSAWTFAWITPALAFCIMLGLVADVYGFISFHFPQAVYPVVVLVILAGVVASLAADKHRLPELDYSNEQSLDTASYEDRRKQDCGLLKAEVLDRWLAYYREHQAASSAEKPKLVVVADQPCRLWASAGCHHVVPLAADGENQLGRVLRLRGARRCCARWEGNESGDEFGEGGRLLSRHA